jgi:multiple sugar transport system substrate-binding protein
VATTAPAAGATTAPAKPAAAPTVSASTKVQLQNARLIWWTNDGKVGDRIKPVYGEWMKANPSVQVEDLVIASGELAPKLATAAAANTLPDLYYARTFTTADHAIRGWLTDITDVVKRDTAEVNVDDLEPLMTIKERWQDKWYSMPENFSVMVVYYNKKVFDELKVAYPKATWTWEEFLDTAKKLVQTDGAGKQTRWGTDFFLANWITWGYLLGNGGQVLSQDLRKSMINSKENADTLQFFGDLIHVHKVSPSPTQLPRGIHPFGNGLVGMHIGGSWEIPVLREAVGDKFDWDVTALPVGKSGKYGVNVEGGCYGVGGSTRYKEEAWQLLKYSTSPKGIQQMVNSILFSLPGRVSTRANWVEVATTGNKPPKGATVFFDMLKNVPPMVPALPYYEEFSRTFDNRVAAIVSGEKKAAEILPPLDDELNAIIAKTKF